MTTESHRKAVIGSPQNFWLHSSRAQRFDLTHPSHPNAAPITPRLDLTTTTTPITVDPTKTALVIIDMQNFFLSPAFGRARGAGHAAAEQLETHAIPAARKAGIRVIWLNWGLDDADVETMPPAVKRAFGFEAVPDNSDEPPTDAGGGGAAAAEDADDLFKEGRGIGVDKDGSPRHVGGHTLLENGKDGRIYKGLGSSIGTLTLPVPSEAGSGHCSSSGSSSSSTTTTIDAGRLLYRGSWNAALFPPLDALFAAGAALPRTPDVWIHKNRMSGLWGATTPLQAFLESQGIRSLLFAGVNTDQCVSGTLTDAFSKGFDCVLLGDACGTTSPGFAQECILFNAAKTWGFVVSCEEFAKGVEKMAVSSSPE
ncbi:hypothetical protein MBLNU459_g0486t1 [Dothideomycetes sp. NU459]